MGHKTYRVTFRRPGRWTDLVTPQQRSLDLRLPGALLSVLLEVKETHRLSGEVEAIAYDRQGREAGRVQQ